MTVLFWIVVALVVGKLYVMGVDRAWERRHREVLRDMAEEARKAREPR